MAERGDIIIGEGKIKFGLEYRDLLSDQALPVAPGQIWPTAPMSASQLALRRQQVAHAAPDAPCSSPVPGSAPGVAKHPLHFQERVRP